MAATHPATRDLFRAVHINTGIGVEKTREFVRHTAEAQGWPLLEYRATDLGQDYDQLVMEHGFPGPFHHRKMYNRLKQRAVEALVRDHKKERADRVLLVTGVRRYESQRRMGTVQPINRTGAQVWVAPLTWFDGTTKNEYMAAHSLPRNEVVDLLHMSGECLCGAFAQPGELEWLEVCGFADEVRRIKDLERRVTHPRCRWGQRDVPAEAQEEDLFAPGFLCVGCSDDALLARLGP